MFRRTVFHVNTFRLFYYRKMSLSRSKNSCLEDGSELLPVISICHMRSTNDKIDNRTQVEKIVKLSKEKHAKFVFLPECCDYVGSNVGETLKLAETLQGPTMEFYKCLAKENEVWLSIGGFHELAPSKNPGKPDKIFNCHVIIDSDGNLVDAYRKLHLFDVNTPEFKFRESKVVNQGPGIVLPLKTIIGNLGLMICYDLRFSELSTLLRKHGAQILTYPSAFAYNTGLAHWEILLRSRAIENQCFVIASAQIGYHNEKRRSYGHAIVIDPWGRIIAQCNNDCDLDVATVEINLNLITQTESNMPCFDHRRTDVYTLVSVELANSIKSCDFMFGSNSISSDTIFYESIYCVAFTNIRCVVTGHVLVASKRKVNRLVDLCPDETADFFQTVSKVQRILDRYYNTTSSTVTIQDGIDAGQTVPHVHCHIMPRKPNDFPRNDEIYVKLGKHDKEGNAPRRSLSEMIAEAMDYRKIINSDQEKLFNKGV